MEEQTEKHIEIYVWLPTGCLLPCSCSNDGCQCTVRGNYGHAAMLIPSYEGAPREWENKPLYISLYKTKFARKENDRYGYEQDDIHEAYQIKLSCPESQIADLWRAVLKHKKEDSKCTPPDFCLEQDYCIPNTQNYNIDFDYETNEAGAQQARYNCTTFLFDLLKAGGLIKEYSCLATTRSALLGLLQVFNLGSTGYNLGVAIEACEICFPSVRIGGYVSLGLMGLALLLDLGLTVPSRRANPISRAIIDKLTIPSSWLISLPMSVINLGILGYTITIHTRYHTLFDSAPVVLPTVIGAVVGCVLTFVSPLRIWCMDKRNIITRPEALLDEFPDNISSKPWWMPEKRIAVGDDEKISLKPSIMLRKGSEDPSITVQLEESPYEESILDEDSVGLLPQKTDNSTHSYDGTFFKPSEKRSIERQRLTEVTIEESSSSEEKAVEKNDRGTSSSQCIIA